MGHALADALTEAGHAVTTLWRPPGGRHPASAFAGADVTFDFSTGPAVAGNVAHALAGACPRLVIGTTGWTHDRPGVEALLIAEGGAGVAAANFSPGVALFGRLVEEAARLFGPLAAYDPFVDCRRARRLVAVRIRCTFRGSASPTRGRGSAPPGRDAPPRGERPR